MGVYPTPFESLGDRRFQLFAQSLLSYEFPDLQALPVGQPDGGRDAISRGKQNDKFIIFQVKFVERPDYLDDVPTWVRGIIAKERANIERLIVRGAQKYYLVTNVYSSAHLDTGSIDLGHQELSSKISIPSQAFWRADLEVRLAKHRTLKWQYRELLTGPDVLEELVSAGISEDRSRRSDAIAAALGAQYMTDQAVRFKQVELQNDLIDLFIDVPLHIGRTDTWVRVGRGSHSVRWSDDSPPRLVARDIGADPRGAAEVILRQPFSRLATRVVVEGAPGQGKSTLAQYLCQVHRVRLLSKEVDIDRLPKEHNDIVTRLPFKVDLRELATFFRDEDPFASVRGWDGIRADWPRTLVGFLAAQVSRYSGGAKFDVADLLAVARTGPILLVLDGLDEVAEISDRKLVVEMVNDGLAALEEVAESVQVIVTTRPPAFANSPGFSTRSFQYTVLASLTTDLIIEYTKRWAQARRLQEDELTEALSILDAKLDEPHMRDLARNPMQLAILLSLINTKGESLPDKRTLLYQEYMDLYFNREAAKSILVRNYRDILYGLHGHLAWLLHVGAERSAEQGSIALDDLKVVVAKYVESQGADPGLADEMFQGVVERIIALVATRQERFEFEVQPLREFFAAHHLYATAQVSQFGTTRPGTRADRFDALARDAFWLNVARFFAGFYTSGELASLADGLEVLAKDPAFQQTSHVRGLCAMLLADWSFSLDLRSRGRVVELVMADLGKRHAMESDEETLILPRGSGREDVRDACLNLIEKGRLSSERRSALFRALGTHIDPAEFVPQWLELAKGARGEQRTAWLQLGATKNLLGRIDTDDLNDLIAGDDDAQQLGIRVEIALRAGCVALVEESQSLSQALIDRVQAWPGQTWVNDPNGSILAAYSQVVSIGSGGLGMRSLRELQDAGEWPDESEKTGSLVSPRLSPCLKIVDIAKRMRGSEMAEAVEAWSEIVEVLREQAQPSWAAVAISVAVTAATRRGSKHNGLRLSDETGPLMGRVSEARTRSGQRAGRWWKGQFEDAASEFQRCVVALCATLWATGPALKEVLVEVEESVNKLTSAEYERFANIVETAARQVPTRKSGLTGAEIRSLSPRLSLLMLVLTPSDEKTMLWSERLRKYRGRDGAVARRCAVIAIHEARSVEEIHEAIQGARCLENESGWGFLRQALPASIARSVIQNPSKYPLWVVQSAERALRPHITPNTVVGAIAKRDKWFAPA
jgi:hypothetical protein